MTYFWTVLIVAWLTDRKSVTPWFIILLYIIGMNIGCGQSNPQKPRLMIFGDSIAYGVRVNQNYADIIALEFDKTVYNYGVPGTGLATDYQYGKIMATQFQASDVVLYTPGINDIALGEADPTYWTTYQSDLDQIVQYIHASGATLILGTTLHTLNQSIPDPDVQTVGNYARAEVQKYNDPKIILIDGFNNFSANNQTIFTDDCIHPTEIGHQQIAQLYFKIL